MNQVDNKVKQSHDINTYTQDNSGNDMIDLLSLFSALWEKKKLITAVTFFIYVSWHNFLAYFCLIFTNQRFYWPQRKIEQR